MNKIKNNNLPKELEPSPNLVMDNKAKVEDLIREITNRCNDGKYIFRGICGIDGNPDQEDSLSSTLYRKNKGLKNLANLEKGIVERAKEALSNYRNCTNIEILTNLRHYDCRLLLIDFSFDVHVALFFACNGEPKLNGKLIMLERSKVKSSKNVNYKKPRLKIVKPIPDQFSKSRVEAQKSVFVHAPDGYIGKKRYKYDTEPIKWQDKSDILEYLQKYHGINHKTIYNDLIGFIDNEEKHVESRIKVHSGDLNI